jgi:hypothetical protein
MSRREWLSFPRQDSRYGVLFEAGARLADGSQVTVRVTDVSSDGCQLASDHPFHVGELITLEAPEWGRFRAEVRWSASGKAGVLLIT